MPAFPSFRRGVALAAVLVTACSCVIFAAEAIENEDTAAAQEFIRLRLRVGGVGDLLVPVPTQWTVAELQSDVARCVSCGLWTGRPFCPSPALHCSFRLRLSLSLGPEEPRQG